MPVTRHAIQIDDLRLGTLVALSRSLRSPTPSDFAVFNCQRARSVGLLSLKGNDITTDIDNLSSLNRVLGCR